MSLEADAGAIVVGTARLDMRPLVMSDLDGVTCMFADEHAMRNQCRMGDREDARVYIEHHLQFYDRNGFGQFSVHERETGVFVGKCGFSSHEVDGYREFLLSHVIDPAFEKHDYDRETLQAMIEYAFNDLDFMRVVSIVKPGNRRIRRILEDLGMESEKEVQWEGHAYRLYVIHSF